MRIDNAIYDGSFEQLSACHSLVDGCQRLHLIGLVSGGGVRSRIEHLLGILVV